MVLRPEAEGAEVGEFTQLLHSHCRSRWPFHRMFQFIKCLHSKAVIQSFSEGGIINLIIQMRIWTRSFIKEMVWDWRVSAGVKVVLDMHAAIPGFVLPIPPGTAHSNSPAIELGIGSEISDRSPPWPGPLLLSRSPGGGGPEMIDFGWAPGIPTLRRSVYVRAELVWWRKVLQSDLAEALWL